MGVCRVCECLMLLHGALPLLPALHLVLAPPLRLHLLQVRQTLHLVLPRVVPALRPRVLPARLGTLRHAPQLRPCRNSCDLGRDSDRGGRESTGLKFRVMVKVMVK